MNIFDATYQRLLTEILETGMREVNKRTGKETAAVPGLTFSHDIEKDAPIMIDKETTERFFGMKAGRVYPTTPIFWMFTLKKAL
jgi:hypothetical protein